MPLGEQYLGAIRRFEGFNPRPYWDYRQWTSGYGTRARPGEVIDQPEAERRLRTELTSARDRVRGFGAQMSPGQEAALTSLTFNAGPAWMNSGLGSAVRGGDWQTARQRFLEYVNAGGQRSEGLARRRAAEAAWFDQPAAQPTPAQPSPVRGPAMIFPWLFGQGAQPSPFGAPMQLGGPGMGQPDLAGMLQSFRPAQDAGAMPTPPAPGPTPAISTPVPTLGQEAGALPSLLGMIQNFRPAPAAPERPAIGPWQTETEASPYATPPLDLTAAVNQRTGGPPPPPDADAIMRGATRAQAEHDAQRPRQPGYLEQLAYNPLFLAGLSILGTAPGGNWGPAGAQAMVQAQRAQRERTEYERQQSRRAVMDRVWAEAFPNGQPNMQHPLLQGVPPEMASTVFAMGPEQGLPGLQQFAMYRGQQAEQQRIQRERMQQALAMFGGQQAQQPQPAPARQATDLEPGADGVWQPAAGRSPTMLPLGRPTGVPGQTMAPPPTLTPPAPAAAPGAPAAVPGALPQPMVMGMPLDQARRTAIALDAAGMRSEPFEAAIKAAEAEARPPDATRTSAIKVDQAYRSLSTALDDYRRLVEREGIVFMPGQASDAVTAARRNIQLQLKDLYDLGVLNGPDLMLMDQMLPDPSISFSSYGPGGVVPGVRGLENWLANPGERVGPAVDRLKEMLRELRNAKAGIVGLPPIPPPGRRSGEPGGAGNQRLRYNPVTGNLE